MNFLQTAEFKVGALVLAVGALIALMSIQVSDDPSYLGRSKRVWFYLKAADGLIKNSSVKTAGIPIGVIKEIRLEDGKARVTISVKSDVGLTTSAAVRIKSVGILGDRHVDVYPGNPGDPELPDGGQITIVKDTGGLDNLVSEVGEITGSLKNVAKALEESVLEDGTRKHALGRIVHNIERITADISQITAENKDKIGDIVDQVHDITATLDKLINDESEKGLKKTWDKAMARIDSSLKNIDEITSKINRGEGTLGKLVNDDTTVEELNTAIQGVSGMFDSASRIQTAFDVRGDYLGVVGQSKGYLLSLIHI
ncbi:MAG: MlaD family protein, partial [Bdellovibrionaceae bacterium]|nr:MlaD family protein [Pseudobdellovibrionaceae bacterium]